MICYPNAKINLGLHVLNKRFDGYHNIETIMYPLNFLFDSLEVYISQQPSFNIYNNEILKQDTASNICSKALCLLQELCYIPPLDISLIKRIPIGAGLGGGSADATFLIKTLKDHKVVNITDLQLDDLLSRIGSDCLFFYHNTPMFSSETGNTLEPISIDLSNYSILVVDTRVSISTLWAYNNIKIKPHDFSLRDIVKIKIEDWKYKICNDFEDLVFNAYPELAEIKSYLYSLGAIYSSLTGTGGSIYALFDRNNDFYGKLKGYKNLQFFIENS